MYFIVRLIPPIVIAISAFVFPNALRRSPIFPSEADAIIGNSVKIKYLTTSPASLKSFIIEVSPMNFYQAFISLAERMNWSLDDVVLAFFWCSFFFGIIFSFGLRLSRFLFRRFSRWLMRDKR